RARGRTPILVGGSGLYVRAVIDRIDFPGTDAALRAELEAELAGAGPAPLYQRLQQRDPAAAAAILPGNGRRIVRALEVIELTGRPFTATLPRYDDQSGGAWCNAMQIGLDLPDAELDQRVDLRVDRMFDAGLADEVRALEAEGLRDGRTARAALGYRQVLEMLDGAHDEPQARAATARATRRFVRRQRSWFRRDPRVRWLPEGSDPITAALALL
ncbi:MAG TPA: tRNA dimethylallyltransferase, partial [Mycobacteriales bacterium]|nr:tRNA dimethylallyltransferase [Mycobacteriales bacterium]